MNQTNSVSQNNPSPRIGVEDRIGVENLAAPLSDDSALSKIKEKVDCASQPVFSELGIQEPNEIELDWKRIREKQEKSSDEFPTPDKVAAVSTIISTDMSSEDIGGEEIFPVNLSSTEVIAEPDSAANQEMQIHVQEQDNPSSPSAPSVTAPNFDKINGLAAQAPNSDRSSQEILRDILNEFKALDYNILSLSSELTKNNGQFKVKPFTIESEPGKTFYSIEATYIVIAKKGDETQPIQFTRTISTSAITPEDAIVVASQFKQTVCALALKDAKLEVGIPSHFSQLPQDFLEKAMKKKSFSFRFEHNKQGRLSQLRSIQVGTDKDKAEYRIQPDARTKFIYDINNPDQAPASIQVKGEKELVPDSGQIVVETPEEIDLMKYGYAIEKQDEIYEELANKKLLLQHIQDVKRQIKDKASKFQELYATFYKDSFFKWLSGETKGVQQALIDADALAGGEREGVSQNVSEYLNSKELIELHKQTLTETQEDEDQLQNLLAKEESLSEQDKAILQGLLQKHGQNVNGTDKERLEACQTVIENKLAGYSSDIKELEDKLKVLRKAIDAAQGIFNERLGELYKINHSLKSHVEHLRQLQEKAVPMANMQDENEKKGQAEAVLKEIPAKQLKSWEDQIEKDKVSIERIEGMLKNRINSRKTYKAPIDVWEGEKLEELGNS